MAGTDSESQQTSIDCDDLRAVFFAKSLPETMQGITGLSPARTSTYSTYPLRYWACDKFVGGFLDFFFFGLII